MESSPRPGSPPKTATTLRCPQCSKEFERSDNFRRHLARKTACTRQPKEQGSCDCPGCGKAFATKGSRDRHLRTGVCRPPGPTTINNTSVVTNNTDNSVTNNITNNTDNSVTINVTFPTRDFGDENLAYVTERRIQRLLGSIPLALSEQDAGEELVRGLLGLIYANEDHPPEIPTTSGLSTNFTALRGGPRTGPLVTENGRYGRREAGPVARQMVARAVSLLKGANQILSRGSDVGVLEWAVKATETHEQAAKQRMVDAWGLYMERYRTTPRMGAKPPSHTSLVAPTEEDLTPPTPVECRIHPRVIWT